MIFAALAGLALGGIGFLSADLIGLVVAIVVAVAAVAAVAAVVGRAIAAGGDAHSCHLAHILPGGKILLYIISEQTAERLSGTIDFGQEKAPRLHGRDMLPIR